MSDKGTNNTIAAIATPIGEGGLAVVRLSGPEAVNIASRGFRGKQDLTTAGGNTAHFGLFVSQDGRPIDQVVAVVFRQPASYTGEDVVEISCHGGMLVTRRLLQALLDHGAIQAPPGEFTKRAFLNGKIDLTQAEAVADLIHARSDRSHRSSLEQLQGRLADQIESLRDNLVKATGMLELELDFAEEGIELADKKAVGTQLRKSMKSIQSLLDTYRTGRLFRDGVKVVLAGMPNVGKSSILNALLAQDRAIVTDVPGTTRDTIEESLFVNGLMFRIVDTAGLRQAVDSVEREGVRRSHEQIKSSDLLVIVLDGSGPVDPAELELAGWLVRDLRGQARPLVVINKSDLNAKLNGSMEIILSATGSKSFVRTSALTGDGIDSLRQALYETVLAGSGEYTEGGITVTNARHYDALRRSAQSLEMAIRTLDDGASSEFVAVDLRAALNSLGEITGVVTTDDILNEIFSKFCIGK